MNWLYAILVILFTGVHCADSKDINAILLVRENATVVPYCGKILSGRTVTTHAVDIILIDACFPPHVPESQIHTEFLSRFEAVTKKLRPNTAVGLLICAKSTLNFTKDMHLVQLVIASDPRLLQNFNRSTTINSGPLLMHSKSFGSILLYVRFTQNGVADAQLSPASQLPGLLYTISIKFLVSLVAISSILFGALTATLNRNKLLQFTAEVSKAMSKKKTYILNAMAFIALPVILLLTYFFYDVFVYIFIAMFVLVGASLTSQMLNFYLNYLVPSTAKIIPFHCRLAQWCKIKGFLPSRLALFFLALGLTGTWCFFRNDPDVGWPLQCAIGFFVIASILSLHIILPSAKIATILLVSFLIYDVCFVFVTPLFTRSMQPGQSATTEPPFGILARQRRFSDRSVMASVASGTAGSVNESVPLAFRLRLHHTNPCGEQEHYDIMLGFGDAALPGLFCCFLAVYDACWKTPCRRHFLSAIIGYIIGLGIAFLASHLMQMGQPALLYIVPCVLVPPILAALCCGGRAELARLWAGQLPYEVSQLCSTMGTAELVSPSGEHFDQNGCQAIETVSRPQLMLHGADKLPVDHADFIPTEPIKPV